MPPSEKPYSQLERRQRNRVEDSVHAQLQRYCPTLQDAEALLSKVFAKCQSFLPGLQFSDAKISVLIGSLGKLRASVSSHFLVSKIHLPSISVAQLDRAVCNCHRVWKQLTEWGYDIGERSFSKAVALGQSNEPSTSASSSLRNLGGRPSKIKDPAIQEVVNAILKKYVQDSERVLVIGRREKRRVVLAQHLTKRRRAIYMLEKELSTRMSYQVFLKILKIYHPQVKNPRRKTDMCTWTLFSCLMVSRSHTPIVKHIHSGHLLFVSAHFFLSMASAPPPA